MSTLPVLPDVCSALVFRVLPCDLFMFYHGVVVWFCDLPEFCHANIDRFVVLLHVFNITIQWQFLWGLEGESDKAFPISRKLLDMNDDLGEIMYPNRFAPSGTNLFNLKHSDEPCFLKYFNNSWMHGTDTSVYFALCMWGFVSHLIVLASEYMFCLIFIYRCSAAQFWFSVLAMYRCDQWASIGIYVECS